MDISVLVAATLQRLKHLLPKLLLIIIAAMACYGLYYLDSAKRRFEESKSDPILVDEKLKNTIRQYVELEQGDWSRIEPLIAVRQYTTPADFINRVVERSGKIAEARTSLIKSEFNSCVNQVLENQKIAANKKKSNAAQTNTPQNPQQKEAATDTKNPAQPPADGKQGELVSKSKEPSESDNCLATFKDHYQEADQEIQDQVAAIYTYLKPLDLKKVKQKADSKSPITTADTKNATQIRNLTKSELLLEEQSGLYILYQIARITLLVIVVFAMITAIGLLLGSILLTNGLQVVTDRATSLIEAGKLSAVSSGRAAALSVAALGLGTAVGAGVAPSLVPSSAAMDLGTSTPTSGRDRKNSPNPGNDKGATPARADAAKITYSWDDSTNDYSQDNSSHPGNPQPAPTVNVYPNFEGPHNEVKLDEKLVTQIENYIAKTDLVQTEIIKKLQLQTQTSGNDVRVSNHPGTTGLDALKVELSKSPLVIDFKDSQNLITGPLDLLRQQQKVNEDLKNALEEWQKNAQGPTRLATPRSTLTRVFKGPDLYFLSRHAVQQIKLVIETYYARLGTVGALQSAPDLAEQRLLDMRVLDALDLIYAQGQRPENEKVFWKRSTQTLSELLVTTEKLLATRQEQYNKSKDDKEKATLKSQIDQMPEKNPNVRENLTQRLQFWRETILTFARIRQ